MSEYSIAQGIALGFVVLAGQEWVRMHFEAGFAAFPGDSPWVVWNGEPGASDGWMGWPEAVLAYAWGGSCGEETGCGKRALRVGWRVQCGACGIAACCIAHRSAVHFSPHSSAMSNLMVSLRQLAAPASFCLHVAKPGKKRWNKSEIDVPAVNFHSAEKQQRH